MEDGSFKILHRFLESSLYTDSALPLGVQSIKLYFLSKLDQSIGSQLYSIDLDMETNTTISTNSELKLLFTNSSFEIVNEYNYLANVLIFNKLTSIVSANNEIDMIDIYL